MTAEDSVQKNLGTDFLYDQLPSGFISYYPNGQMLRVNETFAKWLGMSTAEICKMNLKQILSKGSALYYNMVIDPLLNLQGVANEISLTLNTLNGEIDILLNAVSYKGESNELILVNATVQKITDRKKYESSLLHERRLADEEKRKFQFLSNTVPNLIITFDSAGSCSYINKKVTDYFGVQVLSFYSGFLCVAEIDRESCLHTWKECLEQGKIFETEVRLTDQHDTMEWFYISIDPYYNKEGQIESWFGSFTNIHKTKSAQLSKYSSLKLSLNSATETLNANKQVFLDIAFNQSHMIRRPLANALGLLELISEEDIPQDLNDLFQKLQYSIQELDKMIHAASKSLNT
jgi:PAS domain S-box-containing protein